eukprot:TRINITY_DN3949_c0_g1_i1.p1 TRINITY_DN3949_c0_g1~~TRINITY_DN3949_c0_g1_i1.p1  ORF type:complete len:118 (-),score=6.11 TRINITY_DN3949_c0_g1_i1:11-364(-)
MRRWKSWLFCDDINLMYIRLAEFCLQLVPQTPLARRRRKLSGKRWLRLSNSSELHILLFHSETLAEITRSQEVFTTSMKDIVGTFPRNIAANTRLKEPLRGCFECSRAKASHAKSKL